MKLKECTGAPAYSGRPIEQIEAILNRDQKSHTYTLALFRALCDIARENQKSAQFVSTDFPETAVEKSQIAGVHIPLRNISEKWVEYYYHLINRERPIPQTDSVSKKMAFQQEIEVVIAEVIEIGGFSTLKDIMNSDFLEPSKKNPSPLTKQVQRLIGKVGDTIVKELLDFAEISTEGVPIFAYDRVTKCVVTTPEIWQTLTLKGDWLHDSLLLGWAGLSTKMEISRGLEISGRGEIISALSNTFDPEKDVLVSRKTLSGLNNLECVWSGKNINRNYDVDHIIAYSLWYNNDLWNLLPVDPKIKRSKADKLPEYDLLKKRKDSIVSCWKVLRSQVPERFISETRRFAGSHLPVENWENLLFATLVESVEITAFQRGVERWSVSESCIRN
ncbi:MAG: HNH endonuclease domain-containing protein [Leptospirales bacterium]